MRSCDHCGLSLPAVSDTCPACGMAAAVPTSTPRIPAPQEPHLLARPATSAGVHTAPIPTPPPGPRLTTPTVTRMDLRIGRPGKRLVLIAGLVVALVAAGGTAYAMGRPEHSGSASVQRYFDALAAGDASAALKLVRSPSNYSDGPLLQSKALADKADRPGRLRIVRSRTDFHSQDITDQSVTVDYWIRGQKIRQTISTERSAPSEDYLLEDPFLGLSVDSLYGRNLTVNGIAVPAGDGPGALNLDAFPGAYTGTARSSALLATQQEEAAISADDTGLSGSLSFDPPELADGAQAAVGREVRAKIDSCAQSTKVELDGCPFKLDDYSSYDDATVDWKVRTYPSINLEVSSGGSGEVRIDSDRGTVGYSVTYTDYDGHKQTRTGDTDFDVIGTATANGSTISLDISSF